MSGVNWTNQQLEEISTKKTDAAKLLELVIFFATLTADERKTIAIKLKQRSYEEGETLVLPGTVAHSLFIVDAGVLSLTRDETEGEMELMRLGPGDHYGEIGMLTGAPSHSATNRAKIFVQAAAWSSSRFRSVSTFLQTSPKALELLRGPPPVGKSDTASV